MKQYKIVSVLWEDASTFSGQALPTKLKNLITPSLTIGILFKKSKRYVIIASHVEKYTDRDDADYMVILRSNILAIKEYGSIPLEELRTKEDSI